MADSASLMGCSFRECATVVALLGSALQSLVFVPSGKCADHDGPTKPSSLLGRLLHKRVAFSMWASFVEDDGSRGVCAAKTEDGRRGKYAPTVKLVAEASAMQDWIDRRACCSDSDSEDERERLREGLTPYEWLQRTYLSPCTARALYPREEFEF
eukprot:m51a1_g5192 hypothetical protein (155) ;mRNA; r:201489-202113